MMYEDNCFITLTYSDAHLRSKKLVYGDFQAFMKRLRDKRFRDLLKDLCLDRKGWKALADSTRKELYERCSVPVFVTGEYGDSTKRPHWHALLFNYRPRDLEYLRTNDRGDRIFKSEELDLLWGFNDPILKPNEVGAVTFESAGYCARYAAKKLVHGNDGEHEFDPVHKRSSRYAIGKKYLIKYWRDVFNHGYVVLMKSDGTAQRCAIPRYYEKWLKDNRPEDWVRYVTEVKAPVLARAEDKARRRREEVNFINSKRHWRKGFQVSDSFVRENILKQRFERLMLSRQGE